MCEKCSSLHRVPDLDEVSLNPYADVIDNKYLSVYIPWKMILKTMTTSVMCTAAAIEINYCPWCGRKLEKENGTA